MFSMILQFIMNNQLILNIGIASILSLASWFVLPHINIDGHHPFASHAVRVFIVTMIYMVGIVKMVISFILKYKSQSFEQIKKYATTTKQFSKKALHNSVQKTKSMYQNTGELFSKDPIPRIFKRLPIYLIMGSEQSGKTSIINNAGHRLLTASYYGKRALQLVGEFPQFDWYFTDQAIFINCGHNIAHEHKLFNKLLRIIKKRRSSKPLAGLLLLFSIPELILAKHDTRRHVIKDYSDQIRLIHRTLKIKVPVYSLLTKSDLIAGFNEYFNHLSKDELMQLWGMTFPLDLSDNISKIEQYYDISYEQLIYTFNQSIIAYIKY